MYPPQQQQPMPNKQEQDRKRKEEEIKQPPMGQQQPGPGQLPPPMSSPQSPVGPPPNPFTPPPAQPNQPSQAQQFTSSQAPQTSIGIAGIPSDGNWSIPAPLPQVPQQPQQAAFSPVSMLPGSTNEGAAPSPTTFGGGQVPGTSYSQNYFPNSSNALQDALSKSNRFQAQMNMNRALYNGDNKGVGDLDAFLSGPDKLKNNLDVANIGANAQTGAAGITSGAHERLGMADLAAKIKDQDFQHQLAAASLGPKLAAEMQQAQLPVHPSLMSAAGNAGNSIQALQNKYGTGNIPVQGDPGAHIPVSGAPPGPPAHPAPTGPVNIQAPSTDPAYLEKFLGGTEAAKSLKDLTKNVYKSDFSGDLSGTIGSGIQNALSAQSYPDRQRIAMDDLANQLHILHSGGSINDANSGHYGDMFNHLLDPKQRLAVSSLADNGMASAKAVADFMNHRYSANKYNPKRQGETIGGQRLFNSLHQAINNQLGSGGGMPGSY